MPALTFHSPGTEGASCTLSLGRASDATPAIISSCAIRTDPISRAQSGSEDPEALVAALTFESAGARCELMLETSTGSAVLVATCPVKDQRQTAPATTDSWLANFSMPAVAFEGDGGTCLLTYNTVDHTLMSACPLVNPATP